MINYNDDLTQRSIKQNDIIKVERPIEYETVFERKEEILDEAEKRYLRDVIRPFRDRTKSIAKYQRNENMYQNIKIELNDDYIILPDFKNDVMYKNMKLGKEYTLKELKL